MATPMKPPIAAETADTQCDPPKLWATQAPIPARSPPRSAGKNLFMTTSTDRVFGYAVLAMKFGFPVRQQRLFPAAVTSGVGTLGLIKQFQT
jgi:hypothetical protein